MNDLAFTVTMENKVEDFEQSDFNSAKATLIRIDEIKKFLHRAAEKDDILSRFRLLFAYYRELVPIFNSKHAEDHTKKFNYLWNQYIEIKKDIYRKGFYSCVNTEHVDEWELELRQLEQDYGMNMPKKRDARYALASR